MKKKILLGVIASAVALTTNSFAFSDVSEDFWAHEAISFMEGRNIVNGFAEDGTFRPGQFATREQTATILRNFFGLELKNKVKNFNDVDINSWSKKYIDLSSQYLYDSDSNNFRPYDFATRVEVAEAILRILGLDLDEANFETIEMFNDYSTFNEEDKKVIALIVENGIMKGYDDGSFLPQRNITRAEICSLLYNAFNGKEELLKKNDDKVVVSVNNDEITVKEFNLYFNVQKRIYEMLFGTPNIWTSEVQNTILYSHCKELTKDELIKMKLVLQKAKELKIELDAKTKESIEAQVKSENGKAVCEYYGINEEELARILEESEFNKLVAEKVYNKISHKNHSHKDINKPIEEFTYDIRHILILTENRTDEEAKEIAEGLLRRLNSGESFEILANEYSEDPGSNENGGLYENIKLGQFVKEIEEVGVNGKVAKIHKDLVKTPYGYHIVKLEGRRTNKIQMSEEEKLEIINVDFEEVLLKWVNEANIVLTEDVYNRI